MATQKTKIAEQAEEIYNSGVVFCETSNFNEAEKCFKEVIKLNPKHDDAWYNLGIALDAMGKRTEAEKCFKKAIELKPDDEDAWKSKGFSLYKSNKNKEAIKCYDKAISINRNNPEIWFLKGISLSKINKNNEAEKCFKKAVELNPKYADACYNEGVVLNKLGKNNLASKWFKRAGELNPLYTNRNVVFLFVFLLSLSSLFFFFGNSITAHVVSNTMYCDTTGCYELCNTNINCKEPDTICCDSNGIGVCKPKMLCVEEYKIDFESETIMPLIEKPMYIETKQSKLYISFIFLTIGIGILYYVNINKYASKKTIKKVIKRK
jgi:tetratricopeptide (TPR) repeat protein